jgi:N-acetylglucosaminyldiphosphoundecaprenol N-acetyl-beta-D-mannosaminyltransferase
MNSEKFYIFDIPFLNISKKNLIELINKRVKNKDKTYIVTANAEIAMYAKENNDYKNLILNADYIIADGIGIVKGGKILGFDVKERIPGIELMIEFLKLANKTQESVYFYGAKKEVLEKMIYNVKIDFPNLNIVGYKDGYSDEEIVLNDIVKLKPDYIFVAKGSPLQDIWINKALTKVDKGIFMGVGGSFDVLSGNVKRAPIIWQKLNLEWLYRIGSNPRRIKRSMALPKFVVEVFKEKLSKEN